MYFFKSQICRLRDCLCWEGGWLQLQTVYAVSDPNTELHPNRHRRNMPPPLWPQNVWKGLELEFSGQMGQKMKYLLAEWFGWYYVRSCQIPFCKMQYPNFKLCISTLSKHLSKLNNILVENYWLTIKCISKSYLADLGNAANFRIAKSFCRLD